MNTVENLKGEIWKEYKDGYCFSNFGRVKRIYKNGKERLLKSFFNKRIQKSYVKVHDKNIPLARTIWILFNGPIPKGYGIAHRNKVKTDNELVNLQMLSRKELGEIYGKATKRRLIYDAIHDCYYKSTREAERKLFISRQTVSDYCNHKVKNPMFDLRWEKKEEQQ